MVGEVTERFNHFYNENKEECINYIKLVKEEGSYKDLETRLGWDFARATKYSQWMPKDEYGFILGDSAKQTTLFKQALRNSDIEY